VATSRSRCGSRSRSSSGWNAEAAAGD
jgi:hypothetical protein